MHWRVRPGVGDRRGGGDSFTGVAPVTGYLMANPQGVSQKAVRKAIRWARVGRLVARLKAVGTLGQDKLWRVNDALSPPPEQAVVGGNCKFPIRGNRKPHTLVVGGLCPAFHDVGESNSEGAGGKCTDGRRGCC